MTVSITVATIPEPWNNASLTTGIQGQLQVLFGSPYDSFTSSNINYNVYQIVYNSSATYGTAYLVVGISSTNNYIYWQLFDGWTKTGANAHTGTNGSQQQIIATLPITSVNITLSVVNGPELKCIFIQQSSWSLTNSCIGLFRPTALINWNENLHLGAFMTASQAPFTLNQWLFTANNPFNTTGVAGTTYCNFQIYNIAGVCPFQNADPNSGGGPPVMTNLLLLYPTQAGYLANAVGYSQSDIAIAGGGFNDNDIINLTSGSTTQTFQVMYSTTKPAFLVRTA